MTPEKQAIGTAAALAARAARKTMLAQLAAGDITLDDVWQLVDAKTKYAVRTSTRALLRNLPGVGRHRIAEVLDKLGVEPDRHIGTLGTRQRAAFAAAAAERRAAKSVNA